MWYAHSPQELEAWIRENWLKYWNGGIVPTEVVRGLLQEFGGEPNETLYDFVRDTLEILQKNYSLAGGRA